MGRRAGERSRYEGVGEWGGNCVDESIAGGVRQGVLRGGEGAKRRGRGVVCDEVTKGRVDEGKGWGEGANEEANEGVNEGANECGESDVASSKITQFPVFFTYHATPQLTLYDVSTLQI